LFASSGSTFADDFQVSHGPILPDYTHFATPLFPVTMSTQDNDDQERSVIAGDASLRDDLLRIRSGLSDDSDYASTIADDSWNPVEGFVGTSSSEGEPDLTHAVSLFDMKSAHDDHEMAGPQHGMVVRDFACATQGSRLRRGVGTRQVAPTPFPERTAPAPDEVSLADTVDMSASDEGEDEQSAAI
jgi:hypothetical protein